MKAILFFPAIEFGDRVHTFLLQEIEQLKMYVDEVHLICLKPTCEYSILSTDYGIRVHTIERTTVYKNALSILLKVSEEYLKMDIDCARRKGLLSIGYVVDLLKNYALGISMYKKALEVIDQKSKWMVSSYWLDSGAFATALLKRLYPQIETVTRAHSIEIDPIKNRFCYCEFKGFIDKYIGKIVFISQSGKEFYNEDIMSLYPTPSMAKQSVIHLGSKKKFTGLTRASTNKGIKIVSCSRLSLVKRVNLIMEAVKKWNAGNIEWVHFGGGEQLDDLRSVASAIETDEKKIVFFGDVPNEEVQRYYYENCIDLFVNVSESEGVPVSVMEAISYGIPVVLTDAGGSREVFRNSFGSILNVHISAEELCKEIEKYLALKQNAPKQYDDMRREAYDFWEREYNINSCYSKYVRFINDDR